ncbi:hypothetical protein [Comamonas sp. MYb396]|uniref:hypothetical protein n=1 Tax=Comamonas sp. MYb396 TaxID=2745302 RepID=UPI0030A1016F
MREELINPAAILAAAIINNMAPEDGRTLKQTIAEAFIQAYRGLELAEAGIQHQDQNGT